MTCDEHQFPEEQTPEGVRILFPCLNCGLSAGDAIGKLKAESAGVPSPPPTGEDKHALRDVYDLLAGATKYRKDPDINQAMIILGDLLAGVPSPPTPEKDMPKLEHRGDLLAAVKAIRAAETTSDALDIAIARITNPLLLKSAGVPSPLIQESGYVAGTESVCVPSHKEHVDVENERVNGGEHAVEGRPMGARTPDSRLLPVAPSQGCVAGVDGEGARDSGRLGGVPSPQEPPDSLLKEWDAEVQEHGIWTSGHSIAARMASRLRAPQEKEKP